MVLRLNNSDANESFLYRTKYLSFLESLLGLAALSNLLTDISIFLVEAFLNAKL